MRVPSGPHSLRNVYLELFAYTVDFSLLTVFKRTVKCVDFTVIFSTSHSCFCTGIVSFTFVLRMFFYFFFNLILFFLFLGRLVLVLYFSLVIPAICYLLFMHVVCCMFSWQINDDIRPVANERNA